MKYILLVLLLLPLTAPAQTPQARPDAHAEFRPRRGAYRVWVTLELSGRRAPGYLLGTSDSSVTMATTNWPPGTWHRDYEIVEVPIRDVRSLKFRRRGRVGIGMAVGAISGTIIGIGIGEKQRDPHSYLDLSGFFGGVLGFIGGTISGGVLGSLKRTYRIEGNPVKWQGVRNDLEKYLH